MSFFQKWNKTPIYYSKKNQEENGTDTILAPQGKQCMQVWLSLRTLDYSFSKPSPQKAVSSKNSLADYMSRVTEI